MELQKFKNYYHALVARMFVTLYGNPSRKIKVIGVTGTDGKTTTSSLIHHILTTAGKRASLITTVSATIAGTEYDTGFHVSTPHSSMIQYYLKKAVDAGDEYFVMETTSHALDQNRVLGVEYYISALTNITHEHLDYHKTYDRYVDAKCKLLTQSLFTVINRDDRSFAEIKKRGLIDRNTFSYGIQARAPQAQPPDIVLDIEKMIGSRLTEFNQYNYLAAYGVCTLLGLHPDDIVPGLASYTPPEGRLKTIQNKPFTVMVDFAHTPNSIGMLLRDLRKTIVSTGQSGRLVHIFGSAAKRDVNKRPVMGQESARHADLIILTEEDYRDEDPVLISREIAKGIEKEGFSEVDHYSFGKKKKTYTILPNRREALERAAAIAMPGDIIVSTGKGHEKSLCRGSIEHPWDESRAWNEILGK